MPNVLSFRRLPNASAAAPFLFRALAIGAALTIAACQSQPEPRPLSGKPSPALSTRSAAPAVPATEATFAFEPFTGAPGNIADELSKSIGTQARGQGLTLVRRVGAEATYRVNGYLSVTGGASAVTLFYVFDIVDSTGLRLKRISGTENLSGTTGDPWEAVDSSALERVAVRSTVEISAWLNRK
ncbi:hypothetical protein [Roseibium litorale]|uniref:Lipoprotein n=1 Tax=Roseibium litorale TaxID=2803841 RepID=A0ABR9CKL7_9HYPH|nr:hypothetical protein [Roseibium litorale]MBD8891394.1 hypothetical protein [Roseibium litorale]